MFLELVLTIYARKQFYHHWNNWSIYEVKFTDSTTVVGHQLLHASKKDAGWVSGLGTVGAWWTTGAELTIDPLSRIESGKVSYMLWLSVYRWFSWSSQCGNWFCRLEKHKKYISITILHAYSISNVMYRDESFLGSWKAVNLKICLKSMCHYSIVVHSMGLVCPVRFIV